MVNLLNAIKLAVNAAPTLSALVGRTYAGTVGESVKVGVADGPYCRVALYPDDGRQYGFADATGTGQTVIQFSVFALTLTAADALVDQIIATFHGVGLSLGSGKVAYGTRLRRGVLVDQTKAPDSSRVFNCYVTVSFGYDGE